MLDFPPEQGRHLLKGRAQPEPAVAAALLVNGSRDPLRQYQRRTRRGRRLGRYEPGRYGLGCWTMQWLFESGPIGIDL